MPRGPWGRTSKDIKPAALPKRSELRFFSVGLFQSLILVFYLTRSYFSYATGLLTSFFFVPT